MERIQTQQILKDLDKKIVLLVGPRQAGKTWIAKHIALKFKYSLYLNYDSIKDRQIMLEQSWLLNLDLLILDELHKMPDWKNYLKGIFDTKPASMRLLVTGSARLDIYDRIGDSLAGRYFKHRLLPLSLSELRQIGNDSNITALIERSGFPEPFLASNDVEAERWRQQYINSMLSTDIFDIDVINNLKAFRLVFDLLRDRVGSVISYNSIAEDVQISPTTVKKYIQILEALYIIFIVTPYSKNIARSVLKEPKIYFFDTGLLTTDYGHKLENAVANCLLKSICASNDITASEYSLQFMRTKDGLEVDFAIVNNGTIETMIEVKTSQSDIHPALKLFHNKYNIPAIQLVQNLRTDYYNCGIKLLNLEKYLLELYL